MEDKLYEIYDSFVDQLLVNGWKGQHYGWNEAVRGELDGGGWEHFQLDNGFNLKLTCKGKGQKETKLQYWFTEKDEVVEVKSLEQLLQLMK